MQISCQTQSDTRKQGPDTKKNSKDSKIACNKFWLHTRFEKSLHKKSQILDRKFTKNLKIIVSVNFNQKTRANKKNILHFNMPKISHPFHMKG